MKLNSNIITIFFVIVKAFIIKMLLQIFLKIMNNKFQNSNKFQLTNHFAPKCSQILTANGSGIPLTAFISSKEAALRFLSDPK